MLRECVPLYSYKRTLKAQPFGNNTLCGEVVEVCPCSCWTLKKLLKQHYGNTNTYHTNTGLGILSFATTTVIVVLAALGVFSVAELAVFSANSVGRKST